MRRFRRPPKHSKPRLILLGAALVITLVWAQSEMRPRGTATPGGGAPQPRGTADAAPAPVAVATEDQATPEGWGTDPFDPRPLGTAPVTTGR